MALLLALVLVLLAPAVASADDTIEELTRPTPVSTWAGHLAWSRYDAAADRYRLVLRTPDGRVAALPVAAGAQALDVDLGPGPEGQLVAVYSRCARTCRLFLFDTRRGRERAVPVGTRARLPSVWRDRIAFARGTRLYVRPLDGGRSVRVPGGPPGRGPVGPTALDLYGRRLAYTWDWTPGGDIRRSDLVLATVGAGAPRLVARVGSGLLSSARMVGPAFARGRLYATKVRRGEAGNRFVRLTLRTGALAEVIGRRDIDAATADGTRFFYVRTGSSDPPCEPLPGESPAAPCALRATGPIAFGERGE